MQFYATCWRQVTDHVSQFVGNDGCNSLFVSLVGRVGQQVTYVVRHQPPVFHRPPTERRTVFRYCYLICARKCNADGQLARVDGSLVYKWIISIKLLVEVTEVSIYVGLFMGARRIFFPGVGKIRDLETKVRQRGRAVKPRRGSGAKPPETDEKLWK